MASNPIDIEIKEIVEDINSLGYVRTTELGSCSGHHYWESVHPSYGPHINLTVLENKGYDLISDILTAVNPQGYSVADEGHDVFDPSHPSDIKMRAKTFDGKNFLLEGIINDNMHFGEHAVEARLNPNPHDPHNQPQIHVREDAFEYTKAEYKRAIINMWNKVSAAIKEAKSTK